MNLRELVDAFREEIRDAKKPYLVSDPMAIRFANRSEVDAARRARLLVDSDRDDICKPDVIAGEPVVDIDSRIISLRRVRLNSVSTRLAKRTVRQMDDEFPGWDKSATRSTPFIIVTDYGTNQLYLYPTPKSNDVLLMTVTREPLRKMADWKDLPEIPERAHDGIVSGMKYLAYTTDDTDLYDEKAAARAQAEFTAEFGPPISSAAERFEFERYDDVGER